jgi:imidazolonepropionase-like amidohydrolase
LTADEGREVVNRLVALRVDLIKVHNGLAKETYLAIADEAKRWKVPFEGHLPVGLNIVEASDAGQRTIEHMAALQPTCAKDPNAIRQPARGAEAITAPIEVDRAKCEEALRHVARNGTWFTPTLGGPGTGNMRVRPFNLTLVQMAHKAGVRLLPSTDWPGGGYWRGDYSSFERSPQDDLIGMVEAGIPALDALRIGTVNPATLFGLSDQLGRVRPGFLADLVVLDADPLVDIQNLKRVSAVVANGRLMDTAMRQKAIDDELASRKPAGQTRN